ncbi:flagellar motor switch protein FliG [Georgenia sp. AZ-5]|uniref:flagellar motor switch protein FliG n=1 Tax=Georgenia sp. AZ-5 TaxID=3367526 RepID=UPI0037553593
MNATISAETLTGTQKVALVLMQMSQERAAEVMKHFSEEEAQEVAADLVRLRRVDAETAEAALDEFYEVSLHGRWRPRGGRDVAAGLLEASFGEERATAVMDRLASSMAGRSFEFLEDAEAGQILSLLDGEHPQTIALVLAHLGTATASAVLSGLDEDVRTDVAQAIATMTTASPEAVAIVADSFKLRIGASLTPKQPMEIVGGVQPLVDIINRADVTTEKAVLDGLTERDPELAEEIRARMLTFADIVKFEARDVQIILRGIDTALLAHAMKGSPDVVVETIRRNLSERNRQLLAEDLDNLGPVRMSQVEEARAEVVRLIRTLEAEGRITISRADEDDYVY